MRLFGLLALASAVAAYGSGGEKPAVVSYDEIFDNSSYPLTDVSCSNGTHGLITKGWKTFADIPLQEGAGLGAFPSVKWNSKKVSAAGLVAAYFAISATKRG